MAAFKVRLKDGVEVGPLDVQMLRSWFEQGMIDAGSPVRKTGSKQWVPLGRAVDVKRWRPSGGAPRERHPDVDDEDLADSGHQRWRTFLASALFFLAAAGAAWFARFPEQWRSDLGATPWREIALALTVPALLLVRGAEGLRKVSRVLVFLLTFSLIPLAAFAIVPVLHPRALAVFAAAWVMGTGLFLFLAGGYLTARSIALSLALVVAGAGGVVALGFVPAAPGGVTPPRAPGAPLAAPSAVAGASGAATQDPAFPAPSSPPITAPAALVAALRDAVPALSPRAAEAIVARNDVSPAHGFKVVYATASRGVPALSSQEARELGLLMTATYATLTVDGRRHLSRYLERVRDEEATSPEEDAASTATMRDAVLKLPAGQRERLQALFEKAIEAGH